MKPLASLCPPILSCAAAAELEQKRFGGDEAAEWKAMQQAGTGIAQAIQRDFQEIGGFPERGRMLVLAGKGHNGGDALIAAGALLKARPRASAEVMLAFGERALRPLAAKAWRELVQAAPDRVRRASGPGEAPGGETGDFRGEVVPYDLCLDGVFGFQYHPPADPGTIGLLEKANALPVRLRAAVDLPSAGLFRADFTYATGSVKAPLLDEAAGRVRYLDLGFFGNAAGAGSAGGGNGDRVLTAALLDSLAALRPARGDKRTYGHVFIVAGSRGYPGAALMCTLAALRSGAGLVTSFVPESLAASFAARLPEAIWVGWPETPAGGLALEGEPLLRERIGRADAVVVGPGMGRDPETLALAESIVKTSPVPLVIDADALQRDIVLAGIAPRVVTPHAGEFERMAGAADLRTFSHDPRLTVILKGPVTRVCGGADIFHSFFGGPVLARGGSGDLLAGMVGTQLAQSPKDPLSAAMIATVWHGLAADSLARARGQVTVETTQVLDYLGAALRET